MPEKPFGSNFERIFQACRKEVDEFFASRIPAGLSEEERRGARQSIAEIDPHFANEQLLLFLREWHMHPNGQIPAYEFAFSDGNPPVHAWAAWQVYKRAGSPGKRNRVFLARVFQELLLNFTRWVNRILVQAAGVLPVLFCQTRSPVGRIRPKTGNPPRPALQNENLLPARMREDATGGGESLHSPAFLS